MRVILAAPRGFCAGVNMAIEALELAIENYGTPLYVYHEIVHNQWVVERFRQQDVIFINDLAEVPEGVFLLYSAHGVPPEIRRQAAARRLKTIDATCPLVTKVHREAIRFAEAGYTILLIGHAGHDEVLGTMGEAPEAIHLVQTVADAQRVEVADAAKVAYLTQTTLSVDDARQIIDCLRQRFPQIVGPPRDDICYATQNRQEAVRILAQESDVVLVVGSQNSSNSRRLAELARSCGVEAHLIDGPTDIEPGWFRGNETVAITAGASAPESLVKECVSLLEKQFCAIVETARDPPRRLAFCLAIAATEKHMKINDLDLYLVSIPRTDSPTAVRSLLVRVRATSGVEGWGESGSGWRVAELAARREALLAVLEGRSPYDIEELHDIDALAPSPLRSAVEMAVWDLLARSLGQPLCNLLGGYYRRRVPVSMRLAGHRSAMAAQISRELAEQGFHTQTIVAGSRPEDDLKILLAIREILGDRVELRFDGTGRYSVDDAREFAAQKAVERLQFLLDPLDTDEIHQVASLARQVNVPLAMWRAIRRPVDVLSAVRCNAAPFIMVDLEQVGGLVPAKACAAIAAAGGAMAVLAGRPSVGIATAAMLHLAAATAAFSSSNELALRQVRDTVLTETLEISDGMMAVPQAPGLGVTVDRAKIERYTESA